MSTPVAQASCLRLEPKQAGSLRHKGKPWSVPCFCSVSALIIGQAGQDMEIRIGAEHIVVAGWHDASEHRVERIVFENGAIWSPAEITLRGRIGLSLAALQADAEGLAAFASRFPQVNGLLLPPGLPADWPMNTGYRPPGAVPTHFNNAQTFVPRRDPLTLDLDGDGLETVGIDPARPLLFDHDGDGVKTASGWIRPDDGFLVLDRNGNGRVDDGRELFGDATPLATGGRAADGFAALAQEDGNGDGRIDAVDARFADLRVWRDLNQDGDDTLNSGETINRRWGRGGSGRLVARRNGQHARNTTAYNFRWVVGTQQAA